VNELTKRARGRPRIDDRPRGAPRHPTALGARVRRLREWADIHAPDVDALAGLPRGKTLLIEEGYMQMPRAPTLVAIAHLFGVDLEWLAVGAGDDPQPEDVRAAVTRAAIVSIARAGRGSCEVTPP
jgi:hypothetical protein